MKAIQSIALGLLIFSGDESGPIQAINITTKFKEAETGDLDDVDESLPEDKKFAEVNSLINKYETAEKKVKWLHSDAYK